jgi:hypothetical protein
MSADDILQQSIIDRLDRIEDKQDKLNEKLDSHIVEQNKSAFSKIKASSSWLVPIASVLYFMGMFALSIMNLHEHNQPLDIPAIKAVASSTYVAGKRIQGISKEIEDGK